MEDLDILRQIPYFANLPYQDLRVLAQFAQKHDYQEGNTIIEEGEFNDSIYFIITGQIKVYLEKISGRELTLGELEPGDIFGEASLLGEKTPSPSVVALRDTRVVRFNKDDLLHGIGNNTFILAKILRSGGFKHSHGPEQDMGDHDFCQRSISLFEKKFDDELAEIKLKFTDKLADIQKISERIENLSREHCNSIEKISEQKISNVEDRSKAAIDSSETRATEAIDAARERISKDLEDSKTRTDLAIKQVEDVGRKVDFSWKKARKMMAIVGCILACIGSVLGWFGISEWKQQLKEIKEVKQSWEDMQKQKVFIDKFREEVNKEYNEFKDKSKKELSDFENYKNRFKDKLRAFSSLEAIVLKIDRMARESQIDHDELDRLKKANINYLNNRKTLIQDYISKFNLEQHKSDVVAEAIDRFLKLIDYSNENIEADEKDAILEASRWLIRELNNDKDHDFRYRLKIRDNLILFGEILKKRKNDYYQNFLLPDLFSIIKDKDLNTPAKFTVAEALARLGESNEESIGVLVSVMDTTDQKVSCWRKYSAAIALMYLQHPRGRAYLITEMYQNNKDCLKAAIVLGEAMLKSDNIKLDEVDHEKLKTIIRQKTGSKKNKFIEDYADEVLARLEKKGK